MGGHPRPTGPMLIGAHGPGHSRRLAHPAKGCPVCGSSGVGFTHSELDVRALGEGNYFFVNLLTDCVSSSRRAQLSNPKATAGGLRRVRSIHVTPPES